VYYGFVIPKNKCVKKGQGGLVDRVDDVCACTHYAHFLRTAAERCKFSIKLSSVSTALCIHSHARNIFRGKEFFTYENGHYLHYPVLHANAESTVELESQGD
jgi:hypothetical protein